MHPSRTPASRKFAPSSSSTSSSRTGHASRFLAPSQQSSSPFTRTPFSGVSQRVAKDDILEDDLESDDSDAVVQHDSHSVRTHSSARQHRALPAVPAETTNAVKRRKISHGFVEAIEDVFPDQEFSSPTDETLPPQPINDETPLEPAETPQVDIQIARSSPEIPDPDPPTTELDQQNTFSPYSTSTISPAKDFATPKHHTSRFRYLPTQPISPHPSTDLNIPSFQSRLLSATTAAPGSHFRGPHPQLDYTLPDTFSPSKNRGTNKEYLRGGHAETVRGWILDVAARASSSPVKPEVTLERDSVMESSSMQPGDGSGHGSLQFFVLRIISRDHSGKFVVVRSDDSRGVWMLLDPELQSRMHSRRGMGGSLKIDRVVLGAKIEIKGGSAMSWGLDETLDGIGGQKCHVAVLWDVVQ